MDSPSPTPGRATRQAAQERLQQAAPRVLARLRAMAELPQFGTVAGQAVASLFWEELNLPISGPVNDIDVFVNRSLPRTMRGLEPLPPDFQPGSGFNRHVSTTSHRTSVSTEHTNYEQVKFLAMRYTTRILRTYVAGLVNFTLIDNLRTPAGQYGHADDVSLELVEGFDLNLVSVGINLETGNVSASNDFLDFLASHQIRVQTCNTPSHTMMRLASKCASGQIKGASCDMDTEMDLLATAISCQRAQQGYDAIDMFGPKYRQVHARLEHLLPPLEHLPQMSDPHKVPGSDDPPETIHLYRLLVPEPATPENAWLVDKARQLRDFRGATLLYMSHFTRLYDAAHPHRSNLDPARAAARRQAMEDLVAEESTNTTKTLEGFVHACRALDLEVFTAPIDHTDEQDQFSFFFGQQAGKSQEQADRAAKAFDGLDYALRHLLFCLKEGADTAVQFQVNPDLAWRDMVRSHGANLLNEWAFTQQNAEVSKASEHVRIMSGFMGAIDAMGEKGRSQMQMMIKGPDGDWTRAMGDSVFRAMDDRLGPAHSAMFMDWMSRKAIPAWPDVSAADPGLVGCLVRGWILSGRPLPAAAVQTASGPLAVAVFRSSATATAPATKHIPRTIVHMDDGGDVLARSMQALTLQDLTGNREVVELALKQAILGRLVSSAAANPASSASKQELQELRDLVQDLESTGNDPKHTIFDLDRFDPVACAQALASIDNLIMQATVKEPNPSSARSGMRF